MGAGPFLVEIMLRGLCLGGLAVLAVGVWRSRASRDVRWAALLACLGVGGYAVGMCGPLREALGPARWPAVVLSFGVGGYLWLFVSVVFEDRRLRWPLLAPAAALTVLGLGGVTVRATAPAMSEALSLARDALAVLLSLHALAIVLADWRHDLVDARRRLRAPFFGVVSGFVMAQTAVDALIRRGYEAPWRDLMNASALALLSVAGAVVLLGAQDAVFGARQRKAARPAKAAADPALATLARLMDVDEVWRREGLTVASLADAVGVPEHRLRRLINGTLGHRNFAAYVNGRRIAAAKIALADPAQAQASIAVLAYDLGFASLGPFNRAFKEAEGFSPRAWRRRAQAARPETLADFETVA